MKKRRSLYITLFFSVVIALSSCFHDHDMSISINDDDDVYRMTATFERDQSGAVHRIINAHLHQHDMSFDQGSVDTNVRLDDGTSFYIRTRPGRLKIKFDRSENTEESCKWLEEMCEEIKEELARSDNDNY
ncbi:MAG TPA: hypothetical protein VK484_07460 [Ferruginibacter sp.]|nr:hypothetical protein [Ferruginibacter sp.]